MNMEENTLQRVRDRLREALSVPYVQKAVLLGIAALSGFLSARGLVFGKYAPFAAAAAAAASACWAWSSPTCSRSMVR